MELDHRRNELVAFDLFMTGVATVRHTLCSVAHLPCHHLLAVLAAVTQVYLKLPHPRKRHTSAFVPSQ